ncbi:MAG: SDR family oxidoreductase [Planctomycetes bacterium]|nr:SDR family oxidoreductase [Planctomycetota bacterium]
MTNSQGTNSQGTITEGSILKGQTAIVSGAGRGIGAAIAKALAAQGANVAVNDIREPTETVQAILDMGRKAISLVGDVSDQASVEAMVQKAKDQLGPVSILVSNAAFSDRELFYQANMEGFRKTIDVCMWGPFYLARAVANQMIAEKIQGNMVFISSPHAYKPIPGATAYNMAKAALDQLAKTAAVELAEYRIRVNLVHPGWTDTPGERKFFFEDELQQHGSNLPWGRLAKPEDIAHGVVFLCDPRSDYITGATLSIDGGIVLPYQEMFRIRNRPKNS